MKKERAEFPKGKQAEFMRFAKEASGKPWRSLGEYFGIKYNTIRSYCKENIRLSFADFEKMCKKLALKPRSVLRQFQGKKIAWSPEYSLKNAVYLGKNKTQLKETQIEYPAKKIVFDNSEITFSKTDVEKNIKLPEKMTPELAEEIGMHMGDGFLSSRKFDYRLKGNKKDEKEYYQKTVEPLFKKLYNANLRLKVYDSAYGFELYSKAIWEFKTKTLGIKPGKKKQIKIPESVKTNNAAILGGFIRGFFDTDGCISFKSQNKNKKYYPVIGIETISQNVMEDTYNMLKMFGLNPKCYKNGNKTAIKLNGYNNLRKYNQMVGWRNPKHLKKIKKWEEEHFEIAKKYMAAVV
ncbi:MAG: hypothetical protein JW772_05550 [Candidatus Diapherotrites archaeon]|nr:hypothetical protein [Candidatus Diapherotrites archaeon]